MLFERWEFVRSQWALASRTDLTITLVRVTLRIANMAPAAVVRRCERQVAFALLEHDPDIREESMTHVQTHVRDEIDRATDSYVTDRLTALVSYLKVRSEEADFPF